MNKSTILPSLFMAACDNPAESPGPQVIIYTITFNSHRGSEVAVITQNEGTKVSKPADPTRTGYIFLGWYSAASGGTMYAWSHTLTGNITMHVQWQETSLPPSTQYTVTFHINGGSPVPGLQFVAVGSTVSEPGRMTKALGGLVRGYG